MEQYRNERLSFTLWTLRHDALYLLQKVCTPLSLFPFTFPLTVVQTSLLRYVRSQFDSISEQTTTVYVHVPSSYITPNHNSAVREMQ
jgi:hypothetical protein